jgi:ABC-type nitrate/sulfonate/bicarbonate transport system substrate-binding protein
MEERMKRRFFGLAALMLSVALTACGGGGGATSSPTPQTRESLSLVTGAIDPAFTQFWTAVVNGYFDKEGLDLSYKVVGSNVVTTIVAGQADIAMIGAASAFIPVNQGIETTVLYSHSGGGSSGFAFGVPKIQSINDCTRVAAFSLGSAGYAWAIFEKALYKGKWDIVGMDVPTAIAAISSGNVDCAIGNYGTFGQLLQQGKLKLLVDPRNKASLPKSFPLDTSEGAIFGLKTTVQKRHGAIQRFLRAMSRALSDIKKETSAQLASTIRKSPDFQPFNETALASTIDVLKPFFSPLDGYVPKSGWGQTMTFYKEGGLTYIDPADPKWSYERRVDMSDYEKAIGKPKGV